MDNKTSEVIKLYKYSAYQKLFTYLRWNICPFREMEKLLPSHGTILDVGCGTGIFTNFLALTSATRDIIGIDISETKINIASLTIGNRKNINFIKNNINNIDLDKINGVVMSDFLHHLDIANQNKILNNIFIKLNNSGTLLIKEINVDDGFRYFVSSLSDKILYPKNDCFFIRKSKLIDSLTNLGFNVRTFKALKHLPLSTNLYICKKTDNSS